ncbi:hypothetical protein ACWDR0_13950 [Streptomyces sp. NPDC003691]
MTELLRRATCPVPVASLRIGVMPEMSVGVELCTPDAPSGSENSSWVTDEQPVHPSGAVRLVGAHDGAQWLQADVPYIGGAVDTINIIGLPGADLTEAAIGVVAPDGTLIARHTVTGARDGDGLFLGQLIHRDGTWSFRAVGQWLKPDEEDTPEEPETAPEPEDEAEDEAVPVPVPRAPDGSWQPGPVFEPYTVEGRGKDVITAPAWLPPGLVIVELEADDNKGYTTVRTIDRSNECSSLFSAPSPRKGRHRAVAEVPAHGRLRLSVDDKRAWTLRILPLSMAERLNGPVRGRGDDVFLYDGPPADLKFRSERYHLIRVHQNANLDNYKSFSGDSDETSPLPVGRLLLRVGCDEAWEIDAAPVEDAGDRSTDGSRAKPEPRPRAKGEGKAPEPLYAGSDDSWPFTPFETFTTEGKGEQVVSAPGGLPNGSVMVQFEALGKRSYTSIYSLNRWHKDEDNLLGAEVMNPSHLFLAEEPPMRRLRMRVTDQKYESQPRPWTVRIMPVTAAPRLDAAPRQGRGHAVFLYHGPLADLRLRTVEGDEHYVNVRAYDNADTSDPGNWRSLISDDGGGTAPLPACKVLLVVKTDARWEIEARPVAD